MPFALLSILQALISAAPVAQRAWETLRPILEAGREPTADEWAALNTMADEAHMVVQGEAKPKRRRASRRVVKVSRPDQGE